MGCLRIYFIRHGATESNQKERLHHADESLTDEGVFQAFSAAAAVDKLKPDIIYSSTAARAMQTASIISRQRVPIISIPAFDERNFGILKGLTKDEFNKTVPDIEEQWKRDGADWKPEGGESLNEVAKRVEKAIDEMRLKNFKTAVVVSHATVISAALRKAMNKTPLEMIELPKSTNCHISGIVIEDNKHRLEYYDKPPHELVLELWWAKVHSFG
jgi:probable phosphoglycerate mutase